MDLFQLCNAITDAFWAVAADGIYFVNSAGAETSRSIEFFSFADGRRKQLFQTDADVTRTFPGLTVSSGGRWLVLPLLENQGSEIRVIDFDGRPVKAKK